MDPSPGRPKVDVCMITYAHGDFLLEAVKSVLMQETTFPVRLIVSDDASPDESGEKLLRFLEDHPKRSSVYYVQRPENLGAMRNFRKTIAEATGEYIAICEGDDFWTDSHKLQCQVDYLETHPEVSGCFHNVDVMTETGERTQFLNEDLPASDYRIEKLFGDWFIPTCSVLFRRSAASSLPEWVNSCRHGDLSLCLHIARSGPLHYLPLNMGVYRRHRGGMSRTHHSVALVPSISFVYHNFDRDSEFRYKDLIDEGIRERIRGQIALQVSRRARGELDQLRKSSRALAAQVSLKTLLKSIAWKVLSWTFRKSARESRASADAKK